MDYSDSSERMRRRGACAVSHPLVTAYGVYMFPYTMCGGIGAGSAGLVAPRKKLNVEFAAPTNIETMSTKNSCK